MQSPDTAHDASVSRVMFHVEDEGMPDAASQPFAEAEDTVEGLPVTRKKRLGSAQSSALSSDFDTEIDELNAIVQPEAQPITYKPSPYLSTGIFSIITWSWLGSLLKLGSEQVLQETDMYELMDEDKAELLNKGIHEAVERVKREQQAANPGVHQRINIWKALWYQFGHRYITVQMSLFAYSGFKIVQPIMLNLLVKFIGDPDEPMWHGVLYALALAGAAVCQTLVHHSYFFHSFRCGVDTRIALNSLIYAKALTLKTTHMLKTTTGQVINLVSNDSARAEDLSIYFPYLWNCPLEIGIVLALLYQEVGVAAFAGFGAILCLTPMQLYFSRLFGKYRLFTVKRTDARVKSVNEILLGADVMKMMSWEQSLESRVNTIREEEFRSIARAAKLKSINQAAFFSSLHVVNLVVFFTMHFRGVAFTPANVFTTISLFNLIKFPLNNFIPFATERLIEARIAFGRIATFLELDEVVAKDHQRFESHFAKARDANAKLETMRDEQVGFAPVGSIKMQQASYVWELTEDTILEVSEPDGNNSSNVPASPSAATISECPSPSATTAAVAPTVDASSPKDSRQGLRSLSLNVAPGQLIGVIGSIGSYKSSFLAACLGEMTQIGGGVLVTGERSYASQVAWIFAGTVRENILFGRPFDAKRYMQTIRACQLVDDLKMMAAGDQTMIGEKGVNLSGGQRARVSCARAVYCEADIYLFDDVLAALDSVVAQRMFEAVMSDNGMLAGKTRVLVTHQTHLLGNAHLVLLDNGRIRSQGSFDQLVAQGHLSEHQRFAQSGNDSAVDDETAKLRRRKEARDRRRKRREEMASQTEGLPKGIAADSVAATMNRTDTNAIVKAEVSTAGALDFGIFLKLFEAGGGQVIAVLVMLFILLGQAVVIVADKHLANWSGQNSYTQVHSDEYAYIYLGLVLATITIGVLRARSFFIFILKAASNLHARMFHHVVYASLRFFEANPIGRILNRFAKDMSITDENLPMTFFDFLQCFFMVLGSLVVIGMTAPFTLLVLIPIIPLFAWVRHRFLSTSRELKRLDATTRSPVYALFSSTLSGLMIIRSFKTEKAFIKNFLVKMDENTRCFITFHMTARWFGLRLDAIAACVVLALCLIIAGTRGSLSPSDAGFALSYCLMLTALFQWAVRQSAEVETMMTSVERIVEYGELPAEGVFTNAEYQSPPGWPEKGTIEFKDYKMRYRPGLDLVLKGVDLSIAPGEKVGVCGRTGAGKSSLFQAILRLVEADSGSIVIDGMEIGKLGLADLRSNLAIIPQSPVIFSGSFRYNLDPFNRATEQQLWAALEAVQLKGLVLGLKDGLDSELAEFGSNISVGEGQLLCVARALLKPSRILLVDEATANVDSKTDALIQEVIREKFADRTVLTIAHRLQTIMDYDKIVVMAAGRVAEVGTPKELLSRPPADIAANPAATFGLFSFMANQKKAAGGH